MTTYSQTITVSRPMHEVVKMIEDLPRQIIGKDRDKMRIGRDMRARMAHTLLMHVSQAFDVKSTGGTDEAGMKWLPLTPKYLAYVKGRPKVMRKRASERGASFERGGNGYRTNRREHLSMKQFRAWKKEYNAALARYQAVFPFEKARAMAANSAWRKTRQMHGLSLMQQYGFRITQILVEDGLLRASLEPGEVDGGSYRKSDPRQLFREFAGMFYVGSNMRIAAIHHESKKKTHGPAKGTVQRRLWPEMSGMPKEWWDEICNQGVAAIFDGLVGELST